MDSLLGAQVDARKDRLAKLRSLKRKQEEYPDTSALGGSRDATRSDELDASTAILSGRNYDVQTKTPKLGFDSAPSDNQETLESRAANIAIETRKAIEDGDEVDKAIDLLSLQPKKLDWDLKRDVDQKLIRLEQMTNNAVARILRDRILQSQIVSPAISSPQTLIPSENLVELVRQREHEDFRVGDNDDLT
ncbi:hypothetical protein ABW20_dc0109233 [Dactylellina cionopaga]|nr:hypothetical protein ABW20_dc0109233 [Dactylellina cionopaga]